MWGSGVAGPRTSQVITSDGPLSALLTATIDDLGNRRRGSERWDDAPAEPIGSVLCEALGTEPLRKAPECRCEIDDAGRDPHDEAGELLVADWRQSPQRGARGVLRVQRRWRKRQDRAEDAHHAAGRRHEERAGSESHTSPAGPRERGPPERSRRRQIG